MTRRKVWLGVCCALGCLLVLPATARAQSSIYGIVKDTSGAVLPGVTVEVASPALIEGTKSATTDGEGAYRIVDLRPGQYTVKFTLTGFATVERSAFQLLSDFNAKIDADLKVGALAETVTVTGQAPIVDVQSATKVAVLDRDALDNIPTGKTIPGLGQLVLGVALSAPDVGGSAGAMNTYMSMRAGAVSSANNTVMVDGMVINGLQGDGSVQTYTNDADFQEMTYQTAGIDASRSSGGVSVNLVPKEGGNHFSGTASGLYRPDYLQASNYSARFIQWGLPVDKNGTPAINRIKRITDFNGSEGGPILKDKLWFFVSGRDFQPINTVPNTFLDDGTQGLDDNFIRNGLVRVTYQMSPKHKFGAYYERVFKWRGHDMSAFNDPETVAIIWTSPNYSTMSAKYTGTISSKLLVEGGFSQNTEYYRNLLQPVVDEPRPGSSAIFDPSAHGGNAYYQTDPWFSTASHSATGGGLGVAAAASAQSFPVSRVWQGAVSYVSGAHHAKLGFSYKNGKYLHGADANADLQQAYPIFNRVEAENYTIYFPAAYNSNDPTAVARFAQLFPTANATLLTNGRDGTSTITPGLAGPCTIGTPSASVASRSACSVTIRNTPRASQEHLNYDSAVFLQDSYTLKRLTVSAGVRYEWFNSQVDDITSPAGRFVPARATTPDLLAQGGKDIPNWRDWAPRLQAVYDLRGDSKTAIKYSWNRYNEAVTTGVAATQNPLSSSTSSRNWTDLNGDDIAQGGVIYTSTGIAPAGYGAGSAIVLPDGSTTYRHYCTYLTPGCEINLSGLTGVSQGALDPSFGLLTGQGTYTQFPRRYHTEQGLEVQHALLPRLSLTGSYYHGAYHNFTETVNWNRRELNASVPIPSAAQYTPVTVFSPIDGTPYLYWDTTANTLTSDNHTEQDTLRRQTYDAWTAEFRMRPYPGAQLTGGIDFERTLEFTCGNSQIRRLAGATATSAWQNAVGGGDNTPAVSDPNGERFCDDRNLVQWGGLVTSPGAPPSLVTATTVIGANGLQVSALPAQGKPFQKNFKLSGAFPIVYGINFGVSYQNIDSGTVAPAYRYGNGFFYPTGTSAFRAFEVKNADGTVARSTALAACPATYGCLAGGATPAMSVGSTGQLIGSFDPVNFADERIVQLDLKASKNFRLGRVTIQPAVEAFNILNVDAVRSRISTEYNVAAGTYLVPNNMLQGRIIGFGANVKW